ncbi:putative endo-beta-1,4-glucanase D [Rhexocercosporidium sp. MPI-PUGE-AT-0058]|nr:putative endo-beta-1,4-glucanase D [Rhexocercosporidium sp. MPI-PUGE-AT-0058]
MKGFATCAAVLALASQHASAHYIFQSVAIGGTKNAPYTYVRKNTNGNSPVTGAETGSNTSTVSLAAGSTLAFSSDTAVYHNGPVSVYMAKAPTTAAAFDGSGNVWFKILDIGPTFPGGTWDLKQTYDIPIPACISAGEYLVRIQSMAIHNPYPALPQFYVSCAQVAITGGGSKDLGPKVAIPGAFKATDPGYTANIYTNFTNYTIPGPEVASC